MLPQLSFHMKIDPEAALDEEVPDVEFDPI
jgi:hypothetical protein